MAILDRLRRLPRSTALRWAQMHRLRRVLSGWDAFRVVARSTRDRSTLNLVLTPMRQPIAVRANTSDVACLEKVFVDEEYRLPVDANPVFAIQPKLIVDAGANIGMATLYFAHAFPGARIVAVEPEAGNFAILEANCKGLRNVTVKHAALWPTEAPLRLANADRGNWGFSVQEGVGGGSPIAAVTVPQLLAESGLPRIDLLKLDIEGAERELFGESCEAWLPKVGTIVIELHDRLAEGCSAQFYSHMVRRAFTQEIRGENIFLKLPDAP
jgi:FkbM family methyltransferase